jgi:DNA-binding PadR family transcriptional regulator
VLRTLEKGGFIETEVVEREGQRPERTRFRITANGREHFRELLRQTWRHPGAVADAIDLALAARSELKEGEIETLLMERADALRTRLADLREATSSAPAPEIVDRFRLLTEAELKWVENLLEGTSKE